MRNSKVLVVGGAGYIGGHVVDYLLDRCVDVLVYDSLVFERDYRKNARFAYGDVLDRDALSAVLDSYEPDSVVWLAAIVGDGACGVNPERTVAVNERSVKWLSQRFDGRIVFTKRNGRNTADEIILRRL